MNNRDYQVLERMLKYCGQIDEANDIFGASLETFSSNSVYRNAACMCVLQIGELAKLLSMDFRKENPEVPWRSWCGIRDIFVHQYEDLNMDVAWDTIENDIPHLRENVERILDEMKKAERS